MTEPTLYEIYKVPNYKIKPENTCKCNGDINNIKSLLLQDFQFHERLEKNNNLKLCVDVDKMLKYNSNLTLEKIVLDVCEFVKCLKNEISYTKNFSVTDGSYHLVIPKYYMKSSLQKQFWKVFQTKYRYGNEIDAGIFDKTGWFRLPNQTKEGVANTQHIIQFGNIEDFVLKYIDNAVEYIFEPVKTNIEIIPKTIITSNIEISNIEIPTDKYLILLFDVIKNEKDNQGNNKINWDNWFKICGILKSNNYSYDVFQQYSNLNDVENKSKELWKTSNNKNMSIHGLQIIAKEINPGDYAVWKRKFSINLYNELFTSGLLADYFNTEFGNLFIYANDVLYFYTGIYWRPDDALNSNLIKFIDFEFYNHLLKTANDNLKYKSLQLVQSTDDNVKDRLDKDIVKISFFIKNITTIRKNSVRKDIVKDIIIKTTNNDIQFDNEPYLYAFKNAVFDLRTKKQITPKPEQYLSITCNTEYNFEYDINLKKEFNEIIDTIFPNPEIKNYFLNILSTGLSGIQMENLFIFTGVGGNGKSLLNSCFLKLLGDYGYKLPSSVIQGEIKTGANPEIANLHKKRYVISQEPTRNKKLNTAVIKEITGDKIINARQLYSKKTETELNLTLVLECNEKPLLDEINQAIVRRLRIIPFITHSIDKEDYEKLTNDERVNVNIANPFYKTDEFQEKYMQGLFLILLDNFNNCLLPKVPTDCIKQTQEYMAISDDLYAWFSDIYEPLTVEELGTVLDVPISLTDIYKEFNISDLFMNMSKLDKRKYNRKGFLDGVEKNIFIKKFIRLRKYRYNNVQLNVDSVVGWKKQEENLNGQDNI